MKVRTYVELINHARDLATSVQSCKIDELPNELARLNKKIEEIKHVPIPLKLQSVGREVCAAKLMQIGYIILEATKRLEDANGN